MAAGAKAEISTAEVVSAGEAISPFILPPFSPDIRVRLTEYSMHRILSLKDDSIQDHMDRGVQFGHVIELGDDRLLQLKGLPGEVAISTNPDELFLPNSNNKTLEEQLRIVEEQTRKVQAMLESDSIEAFLLDAPTLVNLASRHQEVTERPLVSKFHSNCIARTSTEMREGRAIDISGFQAKDGLMISDWPVGSGHSNIHVVLAYRPTNSS
ncbi:MAG: hypothetical protein AAB895_01685 [Patescibacteria group bacterium]